MPPVLSILDLAPVHPGQSVGDALAASVRLAQRAEALGYHRVWYAEHHNMPFIASAATSVVIAHVAAHTSTIRLGAGGVMLPNHSPLVIAEQFGTLAALHPGRIDLGLGRAPGTDQRTVRALRTDVVAAHRFPDDVQDLQGYLRGESRHPGVEATPGRGTDVPLYILGSSLFGAQLAAALGLPYAFASHFSPRALTEAVATYRRDFTPSHQLDEPYVIAGVNAIAAEDPAEAQRLLQGTRRRRASLLFGQGRALSDAEADAALEAGGGAQVDEMMRHTALGRPAEVVAQLHAFAELADADELIIASSATETAAALATVELIAGVRDLSTAA